MKRQFNPAELELMTGRSRFQPNWKVILKISASLIAGLAVTR